MKTLNENQKLNSDESYFGDDELFVSVTDLRGIIKSGNNVFIRVSGYKKEKLIGSPHNIIRHPDMPKTIFRLMWKAIETKNTFCGYVKNRSFDGKYYWVFAIVNPSENNYVSVRLKPKSKYFEKIPQFYKKLLQFELQNNIEQCEQFFNEQIKSFDFENYEAFIKTAFYDEMKIRNDTLSVKKLSAQSYDHPLLLELYKSVSQGEKTLQDSINLIEPFNTFKHIFLTTNEKILRQCKQLEYLSLNMSVIANKLGKDGPSITMIAGAFQKASKEISDRFKKFEQSVNDVTNISNEIKYSLCIAKIQSEMLSFYVAENIEYNKSQNDFRISELINLVNCVKNNFKWVLDHQNKGMQVIKEFRLLCNLVKNLVLSLDLIRMGGKLEGARTNRTEEIFFPYVEKMVECIHSIEEPVFKITETTEEMHTTFLKIKDILDIFDSCLIETEMMVFRDFKEISKFLKETKAA